MENLTTLEIYGIITGIVLLFLMLFFLFAYISATDINKLLKEKIDDLKQQKKELKESYEYQSIKNIQLKAEIDDLKDELKKAKKGISIMNYVEGMSNDYLGTIQDLATCKRVLKEKSERLIEVEKAFTEASLELNSVKDTIKENDDLWTLYRQTVAENNKLKQIKKEQDERINKLQSTIDKKKYTPLNEQEETGYWTPKADILGYFKKGEVYEEMNLQDGLFRLHSLGSNPQMDVSKSWVVDKTWFDISPKPVVKHTGKENQIS